MTNRRVVAVKQVPENVNLKTVRQFYRDLESVMNAERPAVVLDCSRVTRIAVPTMHLLLNCLEGAMKRNGDVRLAAVAPTAAHTLRASGADQLFRIYETTDAAVESFQRRTVGSTARQFTPAEANAA